MPISFLGIAPLPVAASVQGIVYNTQLSKGMLHGVPNYVDGDGEPFIVAVDVLVTDGTLPEPSQLKVSLPGSGELKPFTSCQPGGDIGTYTCFVEIPGNFDASARNLNIFFTGDDGSTFTTIGTVAVDNVPPQIQNARVIWTYEDNQRCALVDFNIVERDFDRSADHCSGLSGVTVSDTLGSEPITDTFLEEDGSQEYGVCSYPTTGSKTFKMCYPLNTDTDVTLSISSTDHMGKTAIYELPHYFFPAAHCWVENLKICKNEEGDCQEKEWLPQSDDKIEYQGFMTSYPETKEMRLEFDLVTDKEEHLALAPTPLALRSSSTEVNVLKDTVQYVVEEGIRTSKDGKKYHGYTISDIALKYEEEDFNSGGEDFTILADFGILDPNAGINNNENQASPGAAPSGEQCQVTLPLDFQIDRTGPTAQDIEPYSEYALNFHTEDLDACHARIISPETPGITGLFSDDIAGMYNGLAKISFGGREYPASGCTFDSSDNLNPFYSCDFPIDASMLSPGTIYDLAIMATKTADDAGNLLSQNLDPLTVQLDDMPPDVDWDTLFPDPETLCPVTGEEIVYTVNVTEAVTIFTTETDPPVSCPTSVYIAANVSIISREDQLVYGTCEQIMDAEGNPIQDKYTCSLPVSNILPRKIDPDRYPDRTTVTLYVYDNAGNVVKKGIAQKVCVLDADAVPDVFDRIDVGESLPGALARRVASKIPITMMYPLTAHLRNPESEVELLSARVLPETCNSSIPGDTTYNFDLLDRSITPDFIDDCASKAPGEESCMFQMSVAGPGMLDGAIPPPPKDNVRVSCAIEYEIRQGLVRYTKPEIEKAHMNVTFFNITGASENTKEKFQNILKDIEKIQKSRKKYDKIVDTIGKICAIWQTILDIQAIITSVLSLIMAVSMIPGVGSSIWTPACEILTKAYYAIGQLTKIDVSIGGGQGGSGVISTSCQIYYCKQCNMAAVLTFAASFIDFGGATDEEKKQKQEEAVNNAAKKTGEGTAGAAGATAGQTQPGTPPTGTPPADSAVPGGTPATPPPAAPKPPPPLVKQCGENGCGYTPESEQKYNDWVKNDKATWEKHQAEIGRANIRDPTTPAPPGSDIDIPDKQKEAIPSVDLFNSIITNYQATGSFGRTDPYNPYQNKAWAETCMCVPAIRYGLMKEEVVKCKQAMCIYESLIATDTGLPEYYCDVDYKENLCLYVHGNYLTQGSFFDQLSKAGMEVATGLAYKYLMEQCTADSQISCTEPPISGGWTTIACMAATAYMSYQTLVSLTENIDFNSLLERDPEVDPEDAQICERAMALKDDPAVNGATDFLNIDLID